MSVYVCHMKDVMLNMLWRITAEKQESGGSSKVPIQGDISVVLLVVSW